MHPSLSPFACLIIPPAVLYGIWSCLYMYGVQYTHRQEVSWELPASASSASALLLLLGPVYLFRLPSFSDTLYRRSLKHVNIHNGMCVVGYNHLAFFNENEETRLLNCKTHLINAFFYFLYVIFFLVQRSTKYEL